MTEMTKEDVRDSTNVALMLDQEIDRRIMVAIIRMLHKANTAGTQISDTMIEQAEDYMLVRIFLRTMAECLAWEGTMGNHIAQRMQMEMRDNFLKQMPDIRITYKGTTAPW